MTKGLSLFDKRRRRNRTALRARAGTRARLSVHRSGKHIYAQVIDDANGTTVEVSGIDRQKVGQVAAEIRRWRKPEPYNGKGIKYDGEYIFRKEGKKK